MAFIEEYNFTFNIYNCINLTQIYVDYMDFHDKKVFFPSILKFALNDFLH